MGPGGSGYFFEHLLTREAAYRALLGKNRRMLHSMAADSLAGLIKPGTADEWGLLPHLIEHLALAGRHREAHDHCCDLLYLAAGSGQHALFAHYEREAEAQLLLAQPEGGPDQTSPALELARGERIYLRFEYPAAAVALERACELAEAAQDKQVLTRVLRRLAALALHAGRGDEAEQHAQRSLRIAEETHALGDVAGALSLLGIQQMRYRRDYPAAEQFYRRALEQARLGGSLRAETVALNNYGILLNENLGQPAAAAQCWEDALAINRAMDNRIGEAINADNLGGVYLSLGRTAEAAALLRTAVQRYGEADDTPGVGSAGGKLGLALLRLGDLPGARRELERSVAILEPLDEDYWRGFTLSYLGSLTLREGDPAQAAGWFARCGELAEELNDPQLRHEAALGLAECALATGELSTAETALQTATSAAEASGSRSGLASALLLRARLHRAEARAEADSDLAAAAHSRAGAAVQQAAQLVAGLGLAADALLAQELESLLEAAGPA